jgi:ATP-dependent DNA ligase
MSTVYSIIEELASNSSRLTKEAILFKHKSNENLKEVFRLAYSPLISFYIRKIPSYVKGKTNDNNLKWAMHELEHTLATRKITGNEAIKHLIFILESFDEENASIIERIIKQDLRCGVGEPTINKIWPGLIKTYPIMLASGFDQKLISNIGFPSFAQLKLDGMRFNAKVCNNKIEFRSRNGKQLDIKQNTFTTAFTRLAEIYNTDIVFDGELLVIDSSGRPLDRKTGNGILTKAIKGTLTEEESSLIRATIWDAIPYNDFLVGIYKIPYKSRLEKLSLALNNFKIKYFQLKNLISLVHTEIVEDPYIADSLFRKFLNEGHEGIIIKSMKGFWEDKRSKEQIKFKAELECDLRVVNWEYGSGKNLNRLGALVCESEDNLIRVNVGSGFSDEQRDLFTKDYVIGKIATIKYNARIKDKAGNVESLFLPTFVELREDKNIADIELEIK